ncbi:MAG: LytR family transcriptional regulator [Actinobacteria bacterium ATB1]|nr:LytR family transcriptional regulator [Actinobacteria bacterium ATB1]
MRVWAVVSTLLLCTAAAGGWVAYGLYRVDRSIERVPVEGLADPPVPETTQPTDSAPETAPSTLATRSRPEFEVDPNAVAAHPNARFYLLLGSDSRAGHPFAATQGMTGRGRTDVIVLVRVIPGRVPMLLSIPRDLRVRLPGSSGYEKVNAAYARGGLSLAVKTITERFGIPVHHVALVDFAGFERVIEVLGGVEVCTEFAERDSYSDLSKEAGCQTLDGPAALSYVRARHAEQLVGGTWRTDPSGDFGRMARQQAVLFGLARKLRDAQNLARLPSLAAALEGSVSVDEGFTLAEMLALGSDYGGSLDETVKAALPGKGGLVGGVYYVRPNQETQSIVDGFKSGTL